MGFCINMVYKNLCKYIFINNSNVDGYDDDGGDKIYIYFDY